MPRLRYRRSETGGTPLFHPAAMRFDEPSKQVMLDQDVERLNQILETKGRPTPPRLLLMILVDSATLSGNPAAIESNVRPMASSVNRCVDFAPPPSLPSRQPCTEDRWLSPSRSGWFRNRTFPASQSSAPGTFKCLISRSTLDCVAAAERRISSTASSIASRRSGVCWKAAILQLTRRVSRYNWTDEKDEQIVHACLSLTKQILRKCLSLFSSM